MLVGLRDRGWWASDGPVLTPRLRELMRAEVEALWHAGRFTRSQSVRGTDYYDKENVYATEVDGKQYDIAPRMVHYTVAATRGVTARVQQAFPEAQLLDQFIGNKLNMCTGNGASFASHLDVGVAEKPFNRKLTLLIYLNAWRPALGGQISLLGEESGARAGKEAAAGLPASLEPTSGRWVMFWSDRMQHRVEPSYAPGGLPDYRVSYTIWFCTRDAATGPTVGPAAFEEAPGFASALS